MIQNHVDSCRPTNLGGLCRTCEIFGAQELIVDNLMIKNDKLFTALAMSSDRWMPITEVRKEITATYLKEKKRQGYTVVGLEQTSDRYLHSRFKTFSLFM